MHPNDPLYSLQWALTRIGNIETIWNEYSGAGIHVGIYDSGLDLGHIELIANYDASREVVINGTQLSGAVNVAGEDSNTAPGHGTAVAGVIGAEANNGEGIVGVAWGSTLTGVNIFDTTSPIYEHSIDLTDLISAFHQETNFDVVNHSWNDAAIFDPHSNLNGVTGASRINAEFQFVSESGRHGLGTVIVQASANNNLDAQGAGMNASRFTISTAAIGQDGFAADFSNYGACILVTAPGVAIGTTDLTGAAGYQPNDYVTIQGTSLTAPLVSGIAALMLQANANLGWRDVQNILAASATHTGSAFGAVTPGTNENSTWFINHAANWNGGGMHFSNDYGYGEVNAYNAVRMAEVWSLFQAPQTSSNERAWNNFDDTDRAIPDFGSGSLQTQVNLLPDPAMELDHVDVTLGITHTDFTQLRLFLVAPSGTEVQLYDGSGGDATTADGGLTWTFGVDALRGENPSGLWTLRVEDKVAGDTGTLTYFAVDVFGRTASQNSTYHFTDEFLDMKALDGTRAALTDIGGTDWIDAAAVTGNFALNLAAGATSTVNGTAWFTIAGGTTIENAVTGDGNDTLIGNAASNTLYGMRGNDTLDGGAGGDAMHGGAGDDTYVVDSALDIVDEYRENASGIDTVRASISFSLANAARVLGDIENLTLANVASALAATGNALNNVITGNGFANTLAGGAGIDTLSGGIGNDTLRGEAGNDVLTGGVGIDTLTGGPGNDFFVFNAPLSVANRDSISDFANASGNNDTIRLENAVMPKLGAGVHALSAAFFWTGAAAHDANDYVVYNHATGALSYDANGNLGGGVTLLAILTSKPVLTAADFAVI